MINKQVTTSTLCPAIGHVLINTIYSQNHKYFLICLRKFIYSGPVFQMPMIPSHFPSDSLCYTTNPFTNSFPCCLWKMLRCLYLVLCSHYASPLQHCTFCIIHTLKTIPTRNIIIHLDKRFLMYLIRWESNLQLPENILSNRFIFRQNDMHKKCAKQKLGETDAAVNTSPKKSPSHHAQQMDTPVSSAQNTRRWCICHHQQPWCIV